MATVALAVAASSIPGIAAGSMAMIAATTLGSFIDASLVMPALFPGEAIDAGRIGDLRLMGVQEGAPTNYIVGRRMRVAGQLIWQANLAEVASNAGGKGQTVTNFAYYISCQIEICRNQINAVRRVWADGKMVYEDTDPRSITSNDLWLDNSFQGASLAYLRHKSSLEFTEWYDGVSAQVTLSGFPSASNNGTFEVVGKGNYNSSSGSWLFIQRTSGSFVTDENFNGANSITATQPVTGWAADIQRNAGLTPTVHLGGPLQNPNGHMETIEGAGNVPGFRGIAHMVSNALTLRHYGNRIPSWEFLAEVETAVTLEEAFEAILGDWGGIDAQYFDVTALNGSVEGYNIMGIQTIGRVLQPMMLFHRVFVQERAGKLYFFHQADLETIAVAPEDILDQDVSVERVDNVDRPGDLVVHHIDADNDYKQSTQSAQYAEHVGENVHEVSLPFAAPADDVREFCKELLWRMRSDIIRLRFRLGPRFMRLRESDRVSLTWNGYEWTAIVLQATHGHDFSVEVEAIVDTISGISFPLSA